MISEKYFIKNYTAFWKELFPLSNIFIKGLALQSKSNTTELALDTSGRRLSFVSEVGFMIFSIAIKNNHSIFKLRFTNSDYHKIEKQCSLNFEIFDDDNPMLNAPLNEVEYSDAIKVADRLYRTFSECASIRVNPLFSGCGILDTSYGDVLIDDTLFEIKNVNRNFSIQDLRQIITYCAMNYSSNQYNIRNIALYNPRRDALYKIEVNEFAELIAGTSFNELCWKIVFFLSQERTSK